jgi:hypothetical protein
MEPAEARRTLFPIPEQAERKPDAGNEKSPGNRSFFGVFRVSNWMIRNVYLVPGEASDFLHNTFFFLNYFTLIFKMTNKKTSKLQVCLQVPPLPVALPLGPQKQRITKRWRKPTLTVYRIQVRNGPGVDCRVFAIGSQSRHSCRCFRWAHSAQSCRW